MFSLIAVALLSSFWLLLDVVSGYSKTFEAFGVGAFEDRLLPVKPALPPHGVIGYASDNPVDSTAGLGEFYLTQYVLAPAIVSASPVPKGSLEVVNFHAPRPDLSKLEPLHLTIIQNFGSGVLLCRKNQ